MHKRENSIRRQLEDSLMAGYKPEEGSDDVVQANLFEAVFESMTDAALIYNRDGSIARANTSARNLFSMDEYPAYALLPLEQRLRMLRIRQKDGAPYPEEDWSVRRVLRGEILHDQQAKDVILQTPSGRNVYLSMTGAPIRNQHAEIIGALLVLRDITDRCVLEIRVQKAFSELLTLVEDLIHLTGQKERPSKADKSTVQVVEEAAQRLAELIHHVLDSRFVSIVLIDAASEKMHLLAVASQEPGLVQRLPEKVTGSRLANHVDVETVNRLKALEVVQCGIKDVVPGKNPNAQIQDVLLAPMALKSSLMGVLVVRKRDVRNEYTAEEIALVKAAATLILVVIERERWQQQCLLAQANEMALTETNRRFDEFLSIASHELRTPLTTIGGNIQLALRRLVNVQKRELPPEDPLASKLECVQTPLICANHRVNVQNRMISDMLDGSRIQANRFTLSTKRCNLLEIVRRAVEDQRSVTPDRTIELALPQCDTIPVVADEDRIAQVVDNYLSNALKYSPAHKPVMVRMIGTECEVRVLVRDEGPGLTPEEQRQVWERFYRSDRVDVQQALSSGGGLGLGLHICCTIIEYHKGTYGVESQPGQGSTFWFALPLASS